MKTAISRRSVITLAFALAAGAAPLCAPAAASSGSGAQAELERFLSAVGGAEGAFEQTTRDRTGKLVSEAKGSFAFRRPASFDWAYESPWRQRITSDGRVLRIYDEDLLQVTERAVDAAFSATPAAVLFGEGRVPEGWRVGETGSDEVVLRPDDPAAAGGFEEIRIRFSAGLPEEMDLADAFGQTTRIRFTAFAPGEPAEERFRLEIPEGVEVLRAG